MTHVKAVIKSNNYFSTRLMDMMYPSNDNVLCCSFAIHHLLSLLHHGSTEETEALIRRALRLNGTEELLSNGYNDLLQRWAKVPSCPMVMCNRIYIQEALELYEHFVEKSIFSYQTEPLHIDFNSNAMDEMNESIRKVIKTPQDPIQIPDGSKLVLISAIRFKGVFNRKFKVEFQRDPCFLNGERIMVPCPMMYTAGNYHYAPKENLGAHVIKIPYKNKNVSLIVLLPFEDLGITRLHKKLKGYDLTKISDGLKSTDLICRLPKFKSETEVDLTNPLSRLGLAELFKDGNTFGNMLDENNIWVNKFVQKVHFEIDEDGVEFCNIEDHLILNAQNASTVEPKTILSVCRPFVYQVEVNVNGFKHIILFGSIMNVAAI